jgi:hypothetical protein
MLFPYVLKLVLKDVRSRRTTHKRRLGFVEAVDVVDSSSNTAMCPRNKEKRTSTGASSCMKSEQRKKAMDRDLVGSLAGAGARGFCLGP